jgi:hypothetical protein
MGNKPAGYWVLLFVAIAAVVASVIMRFSPNPHTRDMAKDLAFGAFALLVIARLFFKAKIDPTPPMPRD